VAAIAASLVVQKKANPPAQHAKGSFGTFISTCNEVTL
jgi:hypothetical protein